MSAAKQVLQLLRKQFGIRDKDCRGKDGCLSMQIGLCKGPCLDPEATNYCPDCPMDDTDNTDNPCEYGEPVSACAECAEAGGFYFVNFSSNDRVVTKRISVLK